MKRLLRELCIKHRWQCYYCGEEMTAANATLDHVFPIRKGKENNRFDTWNRVPACASCNMAKADLEPQDWKAIVSPDAPFPGDSVTPWESFFTDMATVLSGVESCRVSEPFTVSLSLLMKGRQVVPDAS